MSIFAVWIGGVVGAACRYAISLLIPYNGGFPYATWLANCSGAFLLSWLLSSSLLSSKPQVKLALTTGGLGAFTTFSAFSAETRHLLDSHVTLALFYVSCSLVGGLLCSYAGYVVAKKGGTSC